MLDATTIEREKPHVRAPGGALGGAFEGALTQQGHHDEQTSLDAFIGPMQPLRCWVVSNGRPGTQNQALGLAVAIRRHLPMSIQIKQIQFRAPWAWLPNHLRPDPFTKLSRDGHLLRAPYPDVWIAAGRETVPLSQALKRHSPTSYVIQTQNPRAPLEDFDIVVPPEHDHLKGDNVLPVIGAPTTVTQQKIAHSHEVNAHWFEGLARQKLAVLIGGSNKYLDLSVRVERRIIRQLINLCEEGYSLIITTSRRTDPEFAAQLREHLSGYKVQIFDSRDVSNLEFNPYPGLLGAADAILVTEDSVNMIGEAVLTGKPVYTLKLDGSPGKFRHYLKRLNKMGMIRRFSGAIETWSYEPLDETARVAKIIANRYFIQKRDGDLS